MCQSSLVHSRSSQTHLWRKKMDCHHVVSKTDDSAYCQFHECAYHFCTRPVNRNIYGRSAYCIYHRCWIFMCTRLFDMSSVGVRVSDHEVRYLNETSSSKTLCIRHKCREQDRKDAVCHTIARATYRCSAHTYGYGWTGRQYCFLRVSGEPSFSGYREAHTCVWDGCWNGLITSQEIISAMGRGKKNLCLLHNDFCLDHKLVDEKDNVKRWGSGTN